MINLGCRSRAVVADAVIALHHGGSHQRVDPSLTRVEGGLQSSKQRAVIQDWSHLVEGMLGPRGAELGALAMRLAGKADC
jgi:hypothetical protein